MKQNSNKNNKTIRFRKEMPERYSICSCGAKMRLKSRKNYPHGKKSKPEISQFYQCEKCGKTKFVIEKQKGGRK
jgi:uncharacterized protein with PIN domain